MKFKIIFIWILYFVSIDASTPALADMTVVNLELKTSNIAQDRPAGRHDDFLYKEIKEEYSRIRGQTHIGRTTSVKWSMINYVPNKSNYFESYNAYHLFDMTWYRSVLIYGYEKEGHPISSYVFPTTFYFNPSSEATIRGVGDVPVLISPTNCFQGMCIGGGGELQGRYKDKTIKEIKRKNYWYKVVQYPVSKAVYLRESPKIKEEQMVELSGEFILDDCLVSTQISKWAYPFDKYSFEFLYHSYFPTKLSVAYSDFEDLKLTIKAPSKEILDFDQDINWQGQLSRENILKKIIPTIFIGIFGSLFLRFFSRMPRLGRVFVYIFTAILLWYAIPCARNIPRLNIFTIFCFLILFIMIIVSEIIHNKGAERERGRGSPLKT